MVKDSPDDSDLERYLRRRDDLSLAYSSLRTETPGAAVDEAVLELARSALEHSSRRRGAWRSRWPALAALAATVVLSVGLVMRVGIENEPALQAPAVVEAAPETIPQAGDEVSFLRRDSAAPASPANAPKAPTVTEESDASRANESLTSTRRTSPAAKQVRSPAGTVAPLAAPDAPIASTPERSNDTSRAFHAITSRQETLSREQTTHPVAESAQPRPSEARDKAVSGAGLEGMSTATSGAAREPPAAAAPPVKSIPPEEWLARIEQLRQAGRNEEADRELERFNASYPEYFETRSEAPTR